MADQIFECPFCLGHFLVPSDAAGGRTLCPHCREVLDIHGLLEGMDSTYGSSAPPSPQAEPSKIQAKIQSIVTDCPSCSGKFQVLASMQGQLVACPHCQSRLKIAPPTSVAENRCDYRIQTDTEQDVAAADLAPEIQGGILDPELEKLLPPKFIVP